ncbi:hypothetical protein CC79DRAFT_4201 [Sarocladium strictum]
MFTINDKRKCVRKVERDETFSRYCNHGQLPHELEERSLSLHSRRKVRDRHQTSKSATVSLSRRSYKSRQAHAKTL